ncbi:MAG: alpha-1,2-fucosyltransferase [Rhodospirillaceae bacterium]
MIIANLKGGLGNQMFQYALAYTLAHKTRSHVKVDLRYLSERRGSRGYVDRQYDLDVFGIPANQANWPELASVGMAWGDFRTRFVLAKILDRVGFRVVCERVPRFEERVLARSGVLYLDGYWQSEKYFRSVERQIRERFSLAGVERNDSVRQLADRIRCQEAVCVNVRRTDFVGHANHDVVTTDYYQQAMVALRKAIGSRFELFIFSDDVEWCAKNLNLHINQNIVAHDYAGWKFSAYLHLMSQCKYFIIPNSTFAWWAAWLSTRPGKIVYAPRIWSGTGHVDAKDIVPSSWILI